MFKDTTATNQTPTPDRRLLHLRPGEVSLFRRFEQMKPLGDALYSFDVRLGKGMPIDPTWPGYIQRMATALTQRRVDFLARAAAELWILEIKVRAGPAAVGQLLTYLSLFIEQYPQEPLVRLGIVADRNSYDMSDVYEAVGIDLFLV